MWSRVEDWPRWDWMGSADARWLSGEPWTVGARLRVGHRPRTFVATLGTEANGSAIADNVLSLARALDLRIVAEGVEEAHQAAILRTLGCDLVQGFLFGRPVPAQDFEVALMGRTNPALRGSSVTRSS